MVCLKEPNCTVLPFVQGFRVTLTPNSLPQSGVFMSLRGFSSFTYSYQTILTKRSHTLNEKQSIRAGPELGINRHSNPNTVLNGRKLGTWDALKQRKPFGLGLALYIRVPWD